MMDKEQSHRWKRVLEEQWREVQADDAENDAAGSGFRAEWYLKAPDDCLGFDDWVCYLQIARDVISDQVFFVPSDPLYLVADWLRPDEQDFMEMKQEEREEVGR